MQGPGFWDVPWAALPVSQGAKEPGLPAGQRASEPASQAARRPTERVWDGKVGASEGSTGSRRGLNLRVIEPRASMEAGMQRGTQHMLHTKCYTPTVNGIISHTLCAERSPYNSDAECNIARHSSCTWLELRHHLSK